MILPIGDSLGTLASDRRCSSFAESLTHSLLGLLWRRRWYLLGALIVTVAVALAFMHVPSPTYRAHTVLKVNGAAIQPDEMDPFTGLFIS